MRRRHCANRAAKQAEARLLGGHVVPRRCRYLNPDVLTLSPEAPDAEYDAINKLVGSNIRLRRKALGVTQQQLADELGMTFQQVQKYEKATNRVSAPVLWRIAKILQCDLMELFKGAPPANVRTKGGKADTTEATLISFMASAGGFELAEAYLSIPERHRRGLLLAGKAMAKMAHEIDA